MCFPSMAFVMVLILILQQKNDSLDLPFYFTLSFFCCFRNANSLLGKRSTAGCFCLINPKKARIFGVFPKRKHCTIVSFVQCGYGCGSQIWTDDLRVMRDLFHIFDIFQTYANRAIMAILRYFFILTFVSLRTAYSILGSVLGSKTKGAGFFTCSFYF